MAGCLSSHPMRRRSTVVVVVLTFILGCEPAGDAASPTAAASPSGLLQNGTAGALGSGTIEAMDEAIQEENRALFTYRKVVADLGEVQPFNTIRYAEERHVASLQRLYEIHGLAGPASEWNESNVYSYAHLRDACATGREMERATVTLYDRLLLADLPPTVRDVFTNLRAAARDHHLPAFERCLARFN